MLYFPGTFHLFTRKITRATNAVINIQVQIFYLHGTYIVNTWIDSSIFNKNRDTTFVKTSLNSRSSLYVCCSLSLLVFISSSSCSCSPNLAQRTNKNKCLFSPKHTIFCRLDQLLLGGEMHKIFCHRKDYQCTSSSSRSISGSSAGRTEDLTPALLIWSLKNLSLRAISAHLFTCRGFMEVCQYKKVTWNQIAFLNFRWDQGVGVHKKSIKKSNSPNKKLRYCAKYTKQYLVP